MSTHIKVLLLFFVEITSLSAAKQVNSVIARPTFIVANKPTTVVIEATIANDPDLLRSSVTLVRVDPTGKVLSTDGTLTDDGLNGDSVPNDNVFTYLLRVNQANIEVRHYAISVVYKGTLIRTLSAPLQIVINTESFSSPPDPTKIVVDSLGTHPSDELLVRLADSSGRGDAETLAAVIGAAIVGFAPLVNTYQFRLSQQASYDLTSAIAVLELAPGVVAVSPNFVVPILSVSNDLTALRTASPSAVAAYSKIDVFDAWDAISPSFFSGSNSATLTPVIIGIIDAGFDRSQSEFHGVDFGASPSTAFSTAGTELVSHGTAVAGIIGAGNISAFSTPGLGQMNGIISGITSTANPAGSAIPYALEVRTITTLATLFDAGHSLNQALGRTVNMSFGYYRKSAIPSNLWDDRRITGHMISDKDFANRTRWFSDMFDANPATLFVIAAGNYPFDVANSTPANGGDKVNVMAVAATDLNDARAKWNDVEESAYGVGIAIAAPGVSVYAPQAGNLYTVSPLFDGTSASAPLVTGTAALLFGLNGTLAPEAVKRYITMSGDPILDQSISGRRLNAWQAVERVLQDYPVQSGRVVVQATLDGSPWPSSGQGVLATTIVCPFRYITNSLVPVGTSYVPAGQCTLNVGAGGPPNSVLIAVSPSTVQPVIAGQTLTFTVQYKSKGSVRVVATLDGSPWSGTLFYLVNGQSGISSTFVPDMNSVPIGQYSPPAYVSAGPANATLVGVAPAAPQTLAVGATLTFTLLFKSGQRPQTTITFDEAITGPLPGGPGVIVSTQGFTFGSAGFLNFGLQLVKCTNLIGTICDGTTTLSPAVVSFVTMSKSDGSLFTLKQFGAAPRDVSSPGTNTTGISVICGANAAVTVALVGNSYQTFAAPSSCSNVTSVRFVGLGESPGPGNQAFSLDNLVVQ